MKGSAINYLIPYHYLIVINTSGGSELYTLMKTYFTSENKPDETTHEIFRGNYCTRV